MEAKREEKMEQEKQETDRAALKIQQKQRVREAKREMHKKKELKKRVAGKHHSLLYLPAHNIFIFDDFCFRKAAMLSFW